MRCISLLVLCAAALAAGLGSPALTVTNPEQSLGPGVWKRIKVYCGVWGSNDYKWGWAREDMETDEWTTWGILPVAMMDHQACPSPTYQWVMGGLGDVPLTGCYRNDMVSRTWTAMAPMPFSLCNGGAAWCGDTIYVMGGYLPALGACVDTVLKYSISGNNWTSSSGPEPGGGPGNGFGWQPSVVTDLARGVVYRLGGCNQPGANSPTNHFWRYAPGPGWTQLASPIHGRVYSHIWFHNDSIWVASGFGSGTQQVTRVCEVYDPATNRWSDAGFPDMPADADNGIWAGGQGCTPYNTGVGVIYSGANALSNISTRDHVFNHQTMTWSSPDTALPVLRYRGCTIGNFFQQCLATGGASSGQQYTNTVVYDSWPGLIHPNDVRVRFLSPPHNVRVSTTYPVILLVKNCGQNAQVDFPVAVSIMRDSTIIYAETSLISLLAGDSVDAYFTDWTSPDTLFVGFTFCGWTPFPNGEVSWYVMTTTDTFFSYAGATPPTIDGYIDIGEWEDAYRADVSNLFGWSDSTSWPAGSAFCSFKHDSAYLYVAVEIPPALMRDIGDEIGLYFDEDNDGVWEPDSSEGNYWCMVNRSGWDEAQYRPWTLAGPGMPGAAYGSLCASGIFNGDLAFECRFPFGTQIYQLTANSAFDTLGLFLHSTDVERGVDRMPGWWPMALDDTLGWRNPALYGKLILRTLQTGDVGVDRIIQPVGRVNPGGTVTPQAVWRNYGTTPMSFIACCFLEDPNGTRFYDERQPASLNGGQQVILTFPTSNPLTMEGGYVVRCTTIARGDQIPANDWKDGAFAVYPPGLESELEGSLDRRARATIVRGYIVIPASVLSPHSSLLMSDGRKVMELRAGENDVRRLAPGVYFVRLDAGDVVRSAKLVIER